MKCIAENLVTKANQDILKQEGVSRDTYKLIYRGTPPWEIGVPQPVIEEIVESNDFLGPILDVGCGYGENAKFLALKGYEICGIDFLEEVITVARGNISHQNLCFEVGDALKLNEKISKYNTVIDSATFHGFSDIQREIYAKQLYDHMNQDSILYIIGISTKELRVGGPRRLSLNVVKKYFDEGWYILCAKDIQYLAHAFPGGASGIMVKLRRVCN